jgi:hypothetical protein
MPFVPIPADVWTEVVTTAAATVVQNVDTNYNIVFTTESTAALPRDEGLKVPPGGALQVGSGNTVSAYSSGRATKVFYMEV